MLARVLVALLVLVAGVPVAGETKIELVYFGSSACGFCNSQRMQDAIVRAIASCGEEAKRLGWSFEAVAVAIDQPIERCGSFKEILPDGVRYVCTGEAYETALFQELIMEKPAIHEGVSARVEGVPYLVVVRDDATGRVVLARYLAVTILGFVDWISAPGTRTTALECVLQQIGCPE